MLNTVTTKRNAYGQRVKANVVRCVRDGMKCLRYRCPPKQWAEHFEAWRMANRVYGQTSICPEPLPEGHSMFVEPENYGCEPA